jgi:hypothetical protein
MGWRLVPDKQTKRDIEAGRPPTYAVETMQFPGGGAGIYMRQRFLDSEGRQLPMRWGQFDSNTLKNSPVYQKKLDRGAVSLQREREAQAGDEARAQDPAFIKGFRE